MQTLRTNQVITRRNWKTDTYYVIEDTGAVFVTPDGAGAYYYDSLAEAQDEYPCDRVVILYAKPDLDLNP